ncbi:MAG: hypothetical protein WDA03_05080 [Trueperaceae bacterium]
MFLRPPFSTWPVFLLRLLHLNVGLLLYGLSIALMVWGAIGLGPWDVFHQGLSLVTPLSFGQAMIIAGFVVLLFSAGVTRVKIGIATVLNMILIGVWSDVFLRLPAAPPEFGWLLGTAVFTGGVALGGLATGIYITAGLGAGPRDGFVLGISRMSGLSVRLSRTLVEITVLVSGWIMGGSVGLGTIIFAVAIGPLMQFFLRLCRPLEQRYDAADKEHRRRRLTAKAAEVEVGAPPSH